MRKRDLFNRFRRPLQVLAAAIGLTALLMNLEFNLLEASLYDLRMRWSTQPAPSEEIVLITIDDKTTQQLNDYAPLPLNIHTRFLESLTHYSPKAIGYLVDMNSVNQVDPEVFGGSTGNRFLELSETFRSKGTPFIIGTSFDVAGEVVPPFPLSSIPHSIAIIHQDGNVFSQDKVTRRALISLYGEPTFHLEFARALAGKEIKNIPGSFYVPEIDGEYVFFRYHGSPENTASGYKSYSFVDVLNRTIPLDALKDKSVLIGTLTKENPYDYTKTPYSQSPFTNPKIVVHANILDSIIHGKTIAMAPVFLDWIITFSAVFLILWSVLSLKPLTAVFVTIGLAGVYFALGLILFQGQLLGESIWTRESQPLVGIFLSYYLSVPYRLIREYKKRWDFQRKNEILVQVEKLKTNFISLVTHDLKTPVARIQGLGESIISRANREEGSQITAEDQKSLRQIISSGDELNKFISSILELSKIEKNQMALNIESKDINVIIEKVIDRLGSQAYNRGIQLVSKFEPLFPIKFDPSLITKVITNLIDNAIKYSPDQSQITIESREIDDWVEISVSDQGIGLTDEEKKNLFSKFYRAQNDSTTKISGTGLGLYLTKFFVEAHRGEVLVESEKGQGTTFRIRLPVDLDPSTVIKVTDSKPIRPGLTFNFRKKNTTKERKDV